MKFNTANHRTIFPLVFVSISCMWQLERSNVMLDWLVFGVHLSCGISDYPLNPSVAVNCKINPKSSAVDAPYANNTSQYSELSVTLHDEMCLKMARKLKNSHGILNDRRKLLNHCGKLLNDKKFYTESQYLRMSSSVRHWQSTRIPWASINVNAKF